MVRALPLLAFAAVLLTAGSASARRVAACDEDGPMSLPLELLRTPAPMVAPALPADEPRPPESRLCVAGVSDDPSCRPFEPPLPSGGSPTPLVSQLYLLAVTAGLPPIAPRSLPRPLEPRPELAAGYARGVERPPRSA